MKSKNNDPSHAYERARKRIKDIKGFYWHLAAYIIANMVVLFTKAKFIGIGNEALGNPDFLNWLDWNVYGTPIVWGIGLAFHGIYVFAFGRAWEERQLKKLMEKEEVN